MAGSGRRRSTSRGRSPYPMLLVLIALLAGTLLILPRVYGPRVDILPSPYPGNPFSLSLSIANQNLTPFTDVQYSCGGEHIEPAGEPLAHDPRVVNQGRRLRLAGRTAMVARCDTAFMIAAPLKSAEYKLTIRYRAFPWPQTFTRQRDFAAQLDGSGQVTGWVAK
jgi:hypothetical protein